MKVNESDFLIIATGIGVAIPDTWSEADTPETTAENRKDYDGGAQVPDIVTAKPLTGDLVIRRNYKTERDAALVKRLRPLVHRMQGSVSITPTDADGIAAGEGETFHGVLVGMKSPNVNANSNTGGMIQLTFAIQSVS